MKKFLLPFLLFPLPLFAAASDGISFRFTEENKQWGWTLTTCEGEEIGETVPDCFIMSHPSRRYMKVIWGELPGDTVAGYYNGIRAVYAATDTGGRGKKLGDLAVGPPSAPLGILCDSQNRIVSGNQTYYLITDPSISFTTLTSSGPVVVPAYVSGCIEAPK